MTFPAARARNFGSIAELYERVRPGYPAEAVAWFLSAAAPVAGELRVADVGTGTGKLTDALLGPARQITAVDPDPGMLAVLSAKHPEVTTVTGTAEQLPFPDASFDVVTFGQSWHWVDPPRGSSEVARVLRPGGSLGLFWNIRDAREQVSGGRWVGELADILGHQSADELMLAAGGPVVTEPLTFDEMREFAWVSTIDVATLVDLAATHGFVITASEADRHQMLDAVRVLGERVADGEGMLRLPYRLYVYRFSAP